MKVLMPLPSRDFDPTETAIPWLLLQEAGHVVCFATPDGQRAAADPLMLSGEGLDAWGFLPLLKKLKLIGLFLRARRDAREAYRAFEADAQFLQPLRYEDIDATQWDGLVVPGGHAPGMRPFLENEVLQRAVVRFFAPQGENEEGRPLHKPVGAICHGVLLVARSIDPETQRSVLYGRKTTALPWMFERKAWNLMRFGARFWDPNYYRTYCESKGESAGYWSVEHEVKRNLATPEDFIDVPGDAPDRRKKTDGITRDTRTDHTPSWVVQDGSYISARWPGDVYAFAYAFLEQLQKAR